MRNITSIPREVLSLLLVLLLFLSACMPVQANPDSLAPIANEVYSLQLGSTIWGINQAISESSGTRLMMKDNSLLFIWTIKDAWAFAGMNLAKFKGLSGVSELMNGNLVNAATIKNLTDFLEENGWKTITAKDVPDVVKIGMSSKLQTLCRMAQSFPTFLVLPAGLFATPDQLKDYQSSEGWY